MKQGGFLSRATATLFVLATVTASTDPGPTVIVKLGGSAVTRKDKFETLNEAALTTTAKQIRASCGDARVLLVHGCGSFGHFQAHEYGISKGTAWPTFSWLGLARTRRSATKLNALILDALLAEELPAVSAVSISACRKASACDSPSRDEREASGLAGHAGQAVRQAGQRGVTGWRYAMRRRGRQQR